MKKIITTLLLSSFVFLGFSQTSITLQPNSIDGKDAMVWDYTPNDVNGSGYEFEVYAWTYSGAITIRRCFIDFDFSVIPSGAAISSATLTLFNNSSSTSTNGEHSQLSGSNEMVVARVVEDWEENTVKWNNQPNTTSLNQVVTAVSASSNQDYLIDVTTLVQDMIDNTNNSFGFGLSLLTEEHYRSLIFASSDHTNSALHPKLELTYTVNNSTLVKENNLNNQNVVVYPNPTNSRVNIKLNNNSIKYSLVEVYDAKGILVFSENLNQQLSLKLNKSVFGGEGLYFIKLISEDRKSQSINKVIIEE